MIATTLAVAAGGCGQSKPPHLLSSDPGSATSAGPADPRDKLAALVAALQDKRYVAAYKLRTDGRAERIVVVSIATDDSWRVDVPGGALGGGANVSIVSDKTGTYQCLLGGPATNQAPPTPTPSASAEPSPSASVTTSTSTTLIYPAPACVKVAGEGRPVPRRYDPDIEHIFTDWLGVMIDRNSPILVFPASSLPDSSGQCYSVEPSSASLAPPMDAGIFCFLPDGTVSAAAIAHNRLSIIGEPALAPPANPLPGPLIDGPAAHL